MHRRDERDAAGRRAEVVLLDVVDVQRDVVAHVQPRHAHLASTPLRSPCVPHPPCIRQPACGGAGRCLRREVAGGDGGELGVVELDVVDHERACSALLRTCRCPSGAGRSAAPAYRCANARLSIMNHACTHARTHARTGARTHRRTQAQAHACMRAWRAPDCKTTLVWFALAIGPPLLFAALKPAAAPTLPCVHACRSRACMRACHARYALEGTAGVPSAARAPSGAAAIRLREGVSARAHLPTQPSPVAAT